MGACMLLQLLELRPQKPSALSHCSPISNRPGGHSMTLSRGPERLMVVAAGLNTQSPLLLPMLVSAGDDSAMPAQPPGSMRCCAEGLYRKLETSCVLSPPKTAASSASSAMLTSTLLSCGSGVAAP